MIGAEPDVYKGLPRRIHVGPHTFRVVIAPADGSPHLVENDGCTVFDEYRVFLRDNLPLQGAVTTVLHEVTHCVNWVYGVTDESTEEQFTTQHAVGQLEVLMRNPRLLSWVAKQVRRMKHEAAQD